MSDNNNGLEINSESSDIIQPDEFEQYISKRLTKMELVQLRKSKGISQKEMAQVSGLSIKCISDIESMTGGNPTLRSIVKYLECLGYEIAFQKKEMK